jgi:NADH-quinone oxidoreductase subunit N
MTPFTEKLLTLWPEIVMLLGAVSCLITGLNPNPLARRLTPVVAGASILIAALIAGAQGADPDHPLGYGGMVLYIKQITLILGLILLLVAWKLPGQLAQNRAAENGETFEPGETMRGEFFAFFLLSLTGVMMTAGATDLVWLFLALELTSLPTYVMIVMSRDRASAHESAVKYFFLGAMAAAVFLYGFALIYGATGATEFGAIAAAVDGAPSRIMLLGVALAILGLCFKIAAVPMHVYAADVYEGAATPVTAFLAFVPKAAGFCALILVVALVGWNPLPTEIAYLLMGIAVLTMTIGNVLGIIQNNLKRVLAYSSVAHSGYILTGLVIGLGAMQTGGDADDTAIGNGPAAILFYLLAYGLSTVGAFAVLASLHKHNPADPSDESHEVQTYDDLSGLYHRHPYLAALMLISLLSLMGMPPLVGFVGKVYLIGGVFVAGYQALAVVMVINSAISAGYYLRIAMVCFFGNDAPQTRMHRSPYRIAGATIASIAAAALGGYAAQGIIQQTHEAVMPTTSIVEPADETNIPDSTVDAEASISSAIP